MSEVNVGLHYYSHSNTNYSYSSDELNESNIVMLYWIIGIFGVIIGINLILFIIYFKEIIKNFYCVRIILRKKGKMVILGELNNKVIEEKFLITNEETNEETNEDDI